MNSFRRFASAPRLLALLLFVLTGCAGPLDGSKLALNAVREILVEAGPLFEQGERAAFARCAGLPTVAEDATCSAAVKKAWAPRKEALLAAREAWGIGLAAVRAAEAAQALGQRADVAAAIAAVSAAIAAADRLRVFPAPQVAPPAAPPAPASVPQVLPPVVVPPAAPRPQGRRPQIVPVPLSV